MAVSVIPFVPSSRMSSLPISLDIFFLFFESLDHFVKCRLSQLFAFNRMVLICLFHSSLDVFPGVVDADRRFEMLDTRPERIYGTALVTIGGMFFILCSSKHLVMQPLEYQL